MYGTAEWDCCSICLWRLIPAMSQVKWNVHLSWFVRNSLGPTLGWLRWNARSMPHQAMFIHIITYSVILNNMLQYCTILRNIHTYSHHPCKFWLISCKWQSPGSPNVVLDWFTSSCLERRSSTFSHHFHTKKITRKIANCACWRHWNHSLSILWHQ